MSFDPLAAHRRNAAAATPTAPITSQTQPEAYVAFDGKDRVERLRIRRIFAPTRSPRYLHLQDLAYDGNFGTNFVLVYDFMLVLVEGKNLQTLIHAIESGTADFMQEYHPEMWPKPADDAPLIESIKVVINGAGADSENTDDLPQKPH